MYAQSKRLLKVQRQKMQSSFSYYSLKAIKHNAAWMYSTLFQHTHTHSHKVKVLEDLKGQLMQQST